MVPASQIPKHTKRLLHHIAAASFLLASIGHADPQSLKNDILALRANDVAWRKIEWETCLLDGLKASRAQGKPLVLWVFIDRPVDDKRC